MSELPAEHTDAHAHRRHAHPPYTTDDGEGRWWCRGIRVDGISLGWRDMEEDHGLSSKYVPFVVSTGGGAPSR